MNETNPYEAAARNQKAALLAGALIADYGLRGTPLTAMPGAAASLSQDTWDGLATVLGINPPSEDTVDAALNYISQITRTVGALHAR